MTSGSSVCSLTMTAAPMLPARSPVRDPCAAVRRAGRRIGHVQVCANDRGAPGADHVDWRGFLAALTDAAYTGPLCIESFTADNATIATAASVWRPLARSQDAIAVDGLAFLRGLLDTTLGR